MNKSQIPGRCNDLNLQWRLTFFSVWNLLIFNSSDAYNFEVTFFFLGKICTTLGWNITAFRDEHITILRKCAASIFMLEGLLLWNDSLKTVSRSVRCICNKNFDILIHCSWPTASRSFPYNGKDILHLSLPYVVWICGILKRVGEDLFCLIFLSTAIWSVVSRLSCIINGEPSLILSIHHFNTDKLRYYWKIWLNIVRTKFKIVNKIDELVA